MPAFFVVSSQVLSLHHNECLEDTLREDEDCLSEASSAGRVECACEKLVTLFLTKPRRSVGRVGDKVVVGGVKCYTMYVWWEIVVY